MSLEYRYDEMDRVTNLVYRDSAGALVRGMGFEYDVAGMITTNTILGRGVTETRHYGYDGLDRLTGEMVLDATGGVIRAATWTYDLAGNRLEQVVDGSHTTCSYGQANRLASWGAGGTMAFDAAGGVTNILYGDESGVNLKWDGQYRLMAAVTTNGAANEAYGYDVLGRRVWTVCDGVTNWHVYDGEQVVADVDAEGSVVRSYMWGPGIDNLLSMTVYGGTTNTYYALKDHLGSVLALTDNAGNIVESYRYDAWGRTTVYGANGSALTASAIGNRYCWQGREYSWKTGLYYFRARWYEPVTGRWLSNDPIGISGGLNQYVFCANNPVNFRDPWGLCEGNSTLELGASGSLNFVAGELHVGVAINDDFMDSSVYFGGSVGFNLPWRNPRWEGGASVSLTAGRDPDHQVSTGRQPIIDSNVSRWFFTGGVRNYDAHTRPAYYAGIQTPTEVSTTVKPIGGEISITYSTIINGVSRAFRILTDRMY